MSKLKTKNLFDILGEEDEDEKNIEKEEEPKILKQKVSVQNVVSNENEVEIEGFKKVNKKKKKKPKQPKQVKEKEENSLILNWQNFPKDLFILLLKFIVANPKDKYRVPGFSKIVCICKNWCNLANSSQFWKYKVDTFKFGTPEQRVFINSQPEEKQVALWKKLYREWMRDTEKREWMNSPVSFWSDTNWMEEYEWQKDNRTYKKVYWDVR